MNDHRYLFSRTIDAALDRAFLWFAIIVFVAAFVMVAIIAIGIAIEAAR